MELHFDAHGMTVLEAKKQLEKMIAQAPANTDTIRVIHGYHSGEAIKEMVRNPKELRSKRIVRRRLTLNQGETLLEIQPK